MKCQAGNLEVSQMADFNLEVSKAEGREIDTPDSLRQEGLDLAFTDGKVTGEPGSEVFEFDGEKFIQDNYGSEQAYLDAQPNEIRQELGLSNDASSKDVYERMAEMTAQTMKTASTEMKVLILTDLGIKEADANQENILEAMVKRDSQRFGLSGQASFQELEKAIHRQSLADVKSGKLPIDYD